MLFSISLVLERPRPVSLLHCYEVCTSAELLILFQMTLIVTKIIPACFIEMVRTIVTLYTGASGWGKVSFALWFIITFAHDKKRSFEREEG